MKGGYPMAKSTTLKAIKRALRKPDLYSDEEYQYLVNGYYQAMVKKELKKQLVKQKGFGYVSKPSINNSTSGADDGVCSESEQSEQPGES